MKRATLFICLIAAVASVFVIGKTPAHAGSPDDTNASSYHIYCDGFTMSGTTGAPNLELAVQYYPSGNYLLDDWYYSGAPSVYFASSGGTFNITAHFPQQPQGTYIYVQVWGSQTQNYHDWDGLGEASPYEPCSGLLSQSGATTWFNPGDGRINGQPADRIAVWCNISATPSNIVVYGVGDATNGSHGFWLGTFNNADLLKAGKAGITKNAGAGNGTISLDTDGKGNYYAAWNGGIFNATGTGIFSKTFSCQL